MLAAVADRRCRPTPGRGAAARRGRSRRAWRPPRRAPTPRRRRRHPAGACLRRGGCRGSVVHLGASHRPVYVMAGAVRVQPLRPAAPDGAPAAPHRAQDPRTAQSRSGRSMTCALRGAARPRPGRRRRRRPQQTEPRRRDLASQGDAGRCCDDRVGVAVRAARLSAGGPRRRRRAAATNGGTRSSTLWPGTLLRECAHLIRARPPCGELLAVHPLRRPRRRLSRTTSGTSRSTPRAARPAGSRTVPARRARRRRPRRSVRPARRGTCTCR